MYQTVLRARAMDRNRQLSIVDMFVNKITGGALFKSRLGA